MRVLQIQLYLLIWCRAAETLDQLTDLGHNVTINCDLDDEDIYWVLQKQSDSPTVILRSFSNPTTAFYFNKTLKNKYSVQSKHRLVIYDITVEELGVYYCMNTDTPPKLSHSTRLNIIEYQNKSAVNCIQQNETQWHIIIIISALMNAALIIVTIGICYSGKDMKLNDSESLQTKYINLEQSEEWRQAQFTAVRFSTCEESGHTQVN